ncbi:hypothetical protein [Pantoea sp. ARC607]|uniref:hypothetical protein n=1 Tax=unclassified Pantoea TaxID=2630326 RepID=UPI001F483542|nr:hypothetical protein [Pantoea sp. ARC607]
MRTLPGALMRYPLLSGYSEIDFLNVVLDEIAVAVAIFVGCLWSGGTVAKVIQRLANHL